MEQDIGCNNKLGLVRAEKRDLDLISRDYYCINYTHQKILVGKRFFIKGKMYDIPIWIVNHPIVKNHIPPLGREWKQFAVSKYSIDDYTLLYSITEVCGVIPKAIKITTVQDALSVLNLYYIAKGDKYKADNVLKEIQKSNNVGLKAKEEQKQLIKPQLNQFQSIQPQSNKTNQPQLTQPIQHIQPNQPQQTININSDDINKIVNGLNNIEKAILYLAEVVKNKEINVQSASNIIHQIPTNQKETSKYYGKKYENLMHEISSSIGVAISEIASKNRTPSLSGVFKQIFLGDLFIENGLDSNNKQTYVLNQSTTHQGLLEALQEYLDSDEKSTNFTGFSWEWFKNEWMAHNGVKSAKDFKEKFL